MKYTRMPIEVESPEEMGYDQIECNLAESSYTDGIIKELNLNLNDLVLCYGDHRGLPELRELIIRDEANLKMDDVLVTVGAAMALFIIATSLLDKHDELIVVRPNYATNIETPKAIEAKIHYIDLDFENSYQISLNEIRKVVSQKTKYISITHPHNPTGVVTSREIIDELIAICEEFDTYLLVDETYRDMTFNNKLPLCASLSSRVISVSSVSKTYGLPGIRTGWLVTQNRRLMDLFLAAKEQIYICGSVVDEYIAKSYLENCDDTFQAIKKDIIAKFQITKEWINSQDIFEWVLPDAGVVGFPRFINPENYNIDLFYKILNKKYSTYVGPGHWFEMPKSYFRLGYGWPKTKELKIGLERLLLAANESKKL